MKIYFKLEKQKEFEVSNGHKWWYERGVYHRLTGPAIEYRWGSKDWWEHDRFIRRER